MTITTATKKIGNFQEWTYRYAGEWEWTILAGDCIDYIGRLGKKNTHFVSRDADGSKSLKKMSLLNSPDNLNFAYKKYTIEISERISKYTTLKLIFQSVF